jgi:hypothetical protein
VRTCRLCDDATLWCPIDEAYPKQIRLEDIFKCVHRFSEQRCHGRNADGPAVELFDHDGEKFAIGGVKPCLVYLQTLQCRCGCFTGDVRGASYLYLVANAA